MARSTPWCWGVPITYLYVIPCALCWGHRCSWWTPAMPWRARHSACWAGPRSVQMCRRAHRWPLPSTYNCSPRAACLRCRGPRSAGWGCLRAAVPRCRSIRHRRDRSAAGAPPSIVQAAAPALAPGLTHPIQCAALALGGAALALLGDGVGRFGGQAALHGQLQALLLAFFCFVVEQLGHSGRPARPRDAPHNHGFWHIALAQGNGVAHAHLAGGLGGAAIDADPAFVNFFGRQAAGFKKAGRTEPFVQAHAGAGCGVGFYYRHGGISAQLGAGVWPATGKARASSTARAVAMATASAARVKRVITSSALGAWPVPRANKVSPSLMVCTGLMARARPSWPTVARRWAWALVSAISVATTPMVVLLPASKDWGAWPCSRASRAPKSWRPSLLRQPASNCPVRGWYTSPTALQAIKAPTVTPCTVKLAVPMPPCMARSKPKILPTSAPAPAPTLPSAGRSWRVDWLAAWQAAYPAAASGRMRISPTVKSNSTAAGTKGR